MQDEDFSKRELMRLIDRVFDDPHPGISVNLFADLCGISSHYFRDVFLRKEVPLSASLQHRASKAYRALLRGETVQKRFRLGRGEIEYRKGPKPALRRETRIVFTPDGFKVHSAVRNKYDYRILRLDEQMESINGRRA